ncbi:MAG TPA: hypothetical protein VFO67_08705 [Gemmatimonadales bacterium]|nr:hypothetical protein [Gemmatimonadales bacterium]
MNHTRRDWTRWTMSAVVAGVMGCAGERTTQPATPTKLAFTLQPTNSIAGMAVAPALQVAIQDESGRTVSSATMTVTIALGSNPGAGALTGTTSVNAVGGIATFGSISIDKAAPGYTLVASAGGLSAATSAPFTVRPATATQLVFTTPPSTAHAGAAIAPAVRVAIRDAHDNTVDDAAAAVTVALGVNSAGGTLTGTTTVNAVGGIATFNNISIDLAASDYTLVATANDLAGATSAAFAIVAGVKAKLDFVVQPTETATAEAVTPAIRVAVQDNFGNTVTDANDAVTVALGANPTGGTLSGAVTVTASNGVATFSDLRIDRPASGYILEATAAGVSGATSGPFDVRLRFASLSAGLRHSCGVTVAGESYCWGSNQYGELGDGTTTDRPIPVLVRGGLRFAVVSAGDYYSCGIAQTGAAYCWGYNGYGQLGNGAIGGIATEPALVTGGLSFAALSAGGYHTCGVSTAGAAYCWGDNSGGQLGDSTMTRRSSPVLVAGGLSFAVVSAGGSSFGNPSHTCGVTTSGDTYCWGHNSSGQLGNGTTIRRLTPALVTGGRTFTHVSAGGGHSCGVTTTGDTYCWGYNGARQIGDGSATDQSTPMLVTGDLRFDAASAGYSHSCALRSSGEAYCWGSNGSGERGDGTNNNPRSNPGLVAGSLYFVGVSARGGFHTCGRTAEGRAYCWGNNDHGQLGDGTVTNRFTPVRVLP